MKTLSLWQPWASLVVHAHKKIETRCWHTSYRGPLLIHAANTHKGFKEAGRSDQWLEIIGAAFGDNGGENLPLGCIIGKVDLIDVRPTEELLMGPYHRIIDRSGSYQWEMSQTEKAFGDYAPGRYGWLLANPEWLVEPIPARGYQRLFNYDGQYPV